MNSFTRFYGIVDVLEENLFLPKKRECFWRFHVSAFSGVEAIIWWWAPVLTEGLYTKVFNLWNLLSKFRTYTPDQQLWLFGFFVYIYIQGMTLPRDSFISHEISGSQLLNQSFAQMRLPWWTCNCWIWILRTKTAVSSSVVPINLWFQSFWKGLKQTTTVFSVIFPISSECKILAWRHMTSLVGGENLALHPVAKGSSNFEWVSTRGRASHIIFISIVTWSVMAVQLAQPSGNMWKQGYLEYGLVHTWSSSAETRLFIG